MPLNFRFNNLEIQNNDYFNSKEARLFFPLLQKELKFPCSIYEIIEFEDVYVIRLEDSALRKQLESEGKEFLPFNENIFGISKITGEILWQIEPLMVPTADSPFTGISKEGDKVILNNWSGCEYTVDPGTGEILDSHFTK
jgi:hypothetical protein